MAGARRSQKNIKKKGKKGKSSGRAGLRPGAPMPPGLGLPPGMKLPPGLSPDLSNLKLPPAEE
jgi:hypothetical protein